MQYFCLSRERESSDSEPPKDAKYKAAGVWLAWHDQKIAGLVALPKFMGLDCLSNNYYLLLRNTILSRSKAVITLFLKHPDPPSLERLLMSYVRYTITY